ncbi:hypothetical protein F2P56_021388 [Juglans regia]|uniref:Uncharacterized protein n=1 Tax=Juglans regia TaxID=51240 RepID=A0A833UR59_JUGRE|nr:hypothetical protein F2P56_021388 [Juglans regia]
MWMAHSTKFLRPIRQSITVITSSYPPIFHSRKSYYAKFEPLKTLIKALEPVLRNRVSAFERQLIPWRKYFCFSGHKLSIGCILAVSVVMESRSFQPLVVYAMDDALDEEEDPWTFWMFAQKFWLPGFLFLTVLTNLDHPIALIAIKIILLLLSTNPCPLSVYVFVGQLCHQSMRKEPHLYRKKFTWACKYTCLLREVGSTNTYVKGHHSTHWMPIP